MIPLAEERLSVRKRLLERRVLIRTVTDETPAEISEDLHAERVEVERVAHDRELTSRPDIRLDGDTMIIPIVEERLVVEKRLFLIEEVHVRRRDQVERVEEPVTLRRQRLVVERGNERSIEEK